MDFTLTLVCDFSGSFFLRAESIFPLFDLVGIKFSSPQFLIDPNSNNPMGVSMDMVYSQTRWADLSQVVKKIEQLSLPDVDIREDQYWNR